MPDSKPLVSVILPAHNSAKWIKESINSVLSQSHKELELIVVDDGSTDTTVALISQLSLIDKRLKLILREECSGGPATPRNDGIKVANGEYLAFIDSDDLWHPQKLELQLRAMKSKSLNFLSSQHLAFQTTPTPISKIDTPPEIRRKDPRKLIRKNWVVTSSAIIEKSLFDGTQFNQQADYIGIEDYLTWLDLHQKPAINSGVLMSPLVLYRLRDDSISASKTLMARKIFYLLSNYSINGKPLGLKKYYYFATYAFSAIINRLR